MKNASDKLDQAIANAERKVSAAEAEARRAESESAQRKAAADDAAKRLAAALQAETVQQIRYDEVAARYADDSSESNARKVKAEREALELARIRTQKPHDAKEAGDRAVEAWRETQAEVNAALASAREALRVAKLQKATSLEEYTAKTAEPFARLLASFEVMREAAREIDAAYAAATDAAGALSEA